MEMGGDPQRAREDGPTTFSWRDGWRCDRCGVAHTRRQACVIDEPLPPPERAQPGAPRITPYAARRQTQYQYAPVKRYTRVNALPPYAVRRRAREYAVRPTGGARTPGVQWISAIVCTSVIVTCLSVAGVYIAHLAEADPDPAVQLAGALIAIGAGLIFGVVPLYYTARAYAGVAYALLALTLFTCGLVMLTAAPIVRQMNTPGLAEYQGFNALITFGVMSTACGIALGVVCARWSLHREARVRLARWSRGFAIGYGVVLALSGALLMWGGAISIDSDADVGIDQHFAENAILFASFAMLTFLPAAALIFHGVASLRRQRTRELRMPIAVLLAAAFGLVVGTGHLIMRADTPIAAPMPLLHVLGAALPGLTYTAMAARGSPLRGSVVRGLSWRQMSLAAALSMSVAVAIAVYVESLGSSIAVALLLVDSNEFEFAETFDQVMNIIFDFSVFLLSERQQLVANLIAAAVLAPVVEEFAKSLSVRFLMHPSSTRAQCFVLGAAAGAAFGFLEALLYGAGWISGGDLALWWQGMVVRAGSSSGHVLWTGVGGVAWWYWSNARRHRLALLLFAAAVAGHAGWNAVFTIIDSRIFFLEELSNRTIEIIAYVIVGVWAAVELTAIPVVARRLREPRIVVEGTQLATMEAWLG